MLTLLAVTWVFPIILNFLVNPGIDQGVLLSGYLGLLLMVASMIGIGVFISTLFNNQLVVYFISLVVMLVLWFGSQLASSSGGLGSQLLSYLSYVDHFYSFYQGTIDLSDTVYYLSLTALALFFGSVSIEMRRWR
jgi:ABC-2 type transport system permease protein